MKTALFLFGLTLLTGLAALPQSAPQAKTPPASKKTATTKTPTKKAPATPTTSKTGTTKTGKAVSKSSSKTGKSTKKAPVRRTQTAPTPERYRDIQAALVEKGYLHGEPTGVWDSDSMDAMRRFQTDQKQTPTGKITASALIGLGLGPKPADSGPVASPEDLRR